MAYEPNDDVQKYEKENQGLKDELEKVNKKVKEDEVLIEKLKSELKGFECKMEKGKPEGLIDFRIIIGMEDSGKMMEMLQRAEEQSQDLKSSNEQLLANYLKVKAEKNIVQDSFKLEKANAESLAKKLENTQKTLKLTETNLSGLQENLLQIRKTQKNEFEKLYHLLKKSFIALGIPFSQNLQIDILGFEDLEEFFQVQTNKIVEITSKVNSELKGKFGIYEIRSLDEVKSAVVKVSEESTRKVTEYKEIALDSEKKVQISQREASDLLKKYSEQQRTFENLQKSISKFEHENKTMKESLEEMERIRSECDQIKLICKKLTEESQEKQRKYEEDHKKFEKTYTYVSHIEEELSEFKAKARTASTSSEEKEKQLIDLKKEKEILISQVHDLKQYSNAEALSTKLYHENIIKKMTEEYTSELKNTNEKFSQQIKNLEAQLLTAKKDSEELRIARIKISEYDNGIQEFHNMFKGVQDLLNASNKKNDELVEEKEKLALEIGEKEIDLERLAEKYEKEVKGLRVKIGEYEEKYKGIDQQVKEAEKMKTEANELLEKVQNKMANEENWIDRRMVITFLINFMNENNTEKMRLMMLRPFAEMLGLDREQRVKIGLEQEPGLLAQFTNFLTRG